MENGDGYVLQRDLKESLRLDCQHFMYKMQYGYTMNPKIPIRNDMRIAEIGTGTALWLLDMSSQLPPTVQLDGFDISDGQFPHKSVLPSNMTLRIQDAFAEVPAELIGTYDVVHMRFWCCVVKDQNTGPLIRHAMSLLKPGGYLQWDETWVNNWTREGDAAQALFKATQPMFDMFNMNFDWVDDLPSVVKKAGLDVVDFNDKPFSPHLIPLATNTFLVGWGELVETAQKHHAASVPSRKETDLLFSKLREAIKMGEAAYHWQPMALLAQKPIG